MATLHIRHRTVYEYATPVRLGAHRMMLRPRDSHDLRLISATLAISPEPAAMRWLHDVFGNSVAIAEFAPEPVARLVLDSRLEVRTYPIGQPLFPVEEYARTFPFAYAADEFPDLARTIERRWADPQHVVDLWAKRFVRTDGPTDTAGLLAEMAVTIQREFRYQARDEHGVQTPHDTLRLASGTCRDFAVLMMEAARSLGFAARFVTGYLYSSRRDGSENVGGGATHAWVQVYLPGAGWVEYDPTNGIIGTRDLIRVAVARDPSQAVPLQGGFIGAPDAFRRMTVDVAVTSEPPAERAVA